MIKGACHCGGVTLSVAHAPEWIGACNCSICVKLGTRIAFYAERDVTIAGPTRAYVWGDRMIGIHHCPICGCMTHWRSLKGQEVSMPGATPGPGSNRMGVSARLIEGLNMDAIEVRLLDNAG